MKLIGTLAVTAVVAQAQANLDLGNCAYRSLILDPNDSFTSLGRNCDAAQDRLQYNEADDS